LISAITVAATNTLVKRGGDVLSARVIMSATMGLCALPFVPIVPLPTPELWGAVALSVAVHWIYQFSMIRALHRGDLSLVFPVMRGLAPFLTAIAAVIFLSEMPTLLGWAGLCLATLALIVFALPEKIADDMKKLRQSALIWAGITSIGIALYSVVDAYGMRLSEQTNLFTFVIWLFLLDWIGVTAVMMIWRRGHVWQDLKPVVSNGFIGGVSGAISYGAALWAFTLADAANVTAMRETSVVFGAIFGAVFLKESFGGRRIAAAAILATGLCILELAS